jgi:hypothetical protein
MTTDEQIIGMYLVGSDHGLIEVLSGNYLEGHKKPTINLNGQFCAPEDI